MEKRGSIVYLEDITVVLTASRCYEGSIFTLIVASCAPSLVQMARARRPCSMSSVAKSNLRQGALSSVTIPISPPWKSMRLLCSALGGNFRPQSVFKHLTLVENLTLALHQPRGVWSTLFGAVGTAQMDKIAPTLATLGLLEKAHHKAGSLAHGEMQWLEIGMVIVQEPALFLLDEPVAGMTKDERERTGQLLQRLAQDHAVLVVEHDMEFVRQTAHRVTVLHEGSILCEGSVDMVQRDPRVVEVYLGRGHKVDAHDPQS